MIAPTDKTWEVAKIFGYEGLEIIPGYTVIREYLNDEKLKVSKDGIVSFHQSFRTDQKIIREQKLKTEEVSSPIKRLKSFLIWNSFPSKSVDIITHQLEKFYMAPVVIHWPSESRKFNWPYLEIHGNTPMTPEQICEWSAKDNKRGLAIDISKRKFWSYLKKQNIPAADFKKVLSQLLLYTKEVHFQISDKDEKKQILKGIYDDDMGKVLRYIKEVKPHLPIVAEIAQPLVCSTAYWGAKPAILQKTIDFIRKA